jgi:hypothetical protein
MVVGCVSFNAFLKQKFILLRTGLVTLNFGISEVKSMKYSHITQQLSIFLFSLAFADPGFDAV